METNEMPSNRERVKRLANGWAAVAALVLLLLGDIGLMIYSIAAGAATGEPIVPLLVASIVGLPVFIVMLTGLFSLQPNEARADEDLAVGPPRLVVGGAEAGQPIERGDPFHQDAGAV